MPELPEVQAWVEELAPEVARSTVASARPEHIATLKTFDPPVGELVGRRFAGATRRGKNLLLETEGGDLVMRVHLMSAGRRLMGVVEGSSRPQQFIPRLIDLYRQGRFPFDRLVRYYPFAAINQALHDSEHGAAIKPILRMD